MATSENDRYLLRKHWKEIKDDLKVERVLDILYSRSVLTIEKCQQIRGQLTKWDKSSMLLEYMLKTDGNGLEQFRHALNQTTPHLGQIFTSSQPDAAVATAKFPSLSKEYEGKSCFDPFPSMTSFK